MDVSLSRPLVRACDFPGCAVAAQHGVSLVHHVMGTDEDYCTEHYPLPGCSECGRRLRPYGTKVTDWPGTALKRSTTPLLCGKCWDRSRHPSGNPKAPEIWTCHCGATAPVKTPGWWLTKYYGPLCPQHVHPLCGGCFRPVYAKAFTGDTAGMVRYQGRGLCQQCSELHKPSRGRNTRRVVLALPQHTIESARQVVPQDLWDMLAISPTQKEA